MLHYTGCKVDGVIDERHPDGTTQVPAKHMASAPLESAFLAACGGGKRMDLTTFQRAALAVPRLANSTKEGALVAFAKSRPRFETTVSFNR
eukprot:8523548-Pyramimonas_sp.AAC.1